MKSIRRFIFAFLLMMWGMNGSAFDYEGISYDVLSKSDKTACVARQLDTDQIVGDVVIPSKVKDGGTVYTVTEISGWAFSSCNKMTSIAIPSTVQRIGYSAFYWCYGLGAVNVEDIAAWCSVKQAGGTKGNPLSLAHRLFLKGEEVKELVIPEGVTAIGNDAFHDASGLTSVVIPSTVTLIGSNAFAECTEIKTLSMDSGVKIIGSHAFAGCRNLTEVTVPEGTERLENSVFYGCGNLSAIRLPQSLLSIGNNAFEGCNSLTTIVIPDQVTELGGRAFYECEKLTSVKLSDNITEIGDWTFTRCYQLKDIIIPKNLQRLGDYALFWCSSIEELAFPSSLTEISNSALTGCIGLRSLSVEEGNPKYLCEDGVLFDHDKATLLLFPAKSDMTHYDIPATVTTIVPAAFSGSQLKSITLSPMLTEIGNSAFSGLVQLEYITIPSSVTSIGASALRGCTSLKELDVPEGVQSIGTSAFAENPSLVRVHLPEGLARIEGWTFDGCTNLSEVNVPEKVNYIGEAAFRGCSSLPAFQIPPGVTIIDDFAFKGCTSLCSITIPNSVSYIGQNAFSNCTNLTTLIIGDGVNEIINEAFANCSKLTDIYCYAASVPKTGNTIFFNSNIENATLHVPAASVSAYQATKPWKYFKEIVALAENDTDDSDYIPFVEENKQWHVARSTSGPNHVYEVSFYIPSGIEEIYGNNYYKMTVNIKNTEFETFLLREKDRKVYIFDNDKQKEYLVFDYSLKEGDTYETYSYEEQKMVTYKVISVGDYTEGPQVKCYHDDEQANNGTTQYRYLRKWTVCRIDNESLQKTWIEGVGSLEEPLANLYDERPISSVSYLAYVQYYANDYLYLPFTINDEFGQVHGCNLPKGKEDYLEDLHHQLSYELEGDRLHVYGKAILICGSNYYALFVEEQTDDPLVHKLHFEMQGVGPSANCMGLYETDFYVSGFDPNINYIVVDNLEEEHPVINKMAYRPFVEEGKVWKVGSTTGIRDGIVKMVEYYYFDGDTIIDGKTCKQRMRQRYVSPNHPDYAEIMRFPLTSSAGAWYEEDKKVYAYNTSSKQFTLMYDFSLGDNETLQINNNLYVVGPKQTGEMKGFKGVYRDVMMKWDGEESIFNTTWLEGVGGIDGPTVSVYLGEVNHALFLMSCTVGDEVIYLNDEYDEEATPEGAKKGRFDFTHTIKIQPKAPRREATNDAEALLVYGEYSEKQLCIKLGPLADAYQVSITDESGKTVYGKAVNALNIVALDIDISTYAEGRYTVTVENAQESFTGEFEVQTTGIKVLDKLTISQSDDFYDLQGRKLSNSKWSNGQIRKGIYIKDGRKFVIK